MTDSTVNVIPATADQGNGVTTLGTPDAVTSFKAIESQEDLDRIISNRLAREKANYADYDALKEKAEKFDQGEAEKLSEIEKASNRAKAAEDALVELRIKDLRRDVAEAKGVPSNLVSGTTKAEMEASADQLISWRGPNATSETPAGPKVNPQQGSPGSSKVSGKAKGLEEAVRRGWVKPAQ